jgi:hypothetical protein
VNSLASLKKLGFRKWYERQLIESHAYLITCLLAVLLVVSLLEARRMPENAQYNLPMLLLAAASVIGAGFAWHRYRRILFEAERLGEAAVCSACGVYGKFSVVRSFPHPQTGLDVEVESMPFMHVRCRQCAHEWDIAEASQI